MENENINNISIDITKLEFDYRIYRERKYIYIPFLILSILLAISGYGSLFSYISMLIVLIIFNLRIKKKRKLNDRKQKLNCDLDNIRDKIEINKFFDIKTRIAKIGR
ncbi:MAG: hypothetical protein WC223_13915 [Bacteroidales bacterium]|jgi:hypothetical protein